MVTGTSVISNFSPLESDNIENQRIQGMGPTVSEKRLQLIRSNFA